MTLHGGCPSTVVQWQKVAGLVFTKTVFVPLVELGPHTHANAYLSYAANGSYNERVGRNTRYCDSSSVLLHPAGETHENAFHDRPVHLLRVEITGDALLVIPDQATSSGDSKSLYFCRRMLCELQRPDDLTPMVLQGLAYEAFASLVRASRSESAPGPAWLRRVDELLADTYLEPLKIANIAGMAGVHPVHLCRTFSKFRGQTIGDRVRELRIQEACRLLAESDQPIGEIAFTCGFSDQSHLARHMRRSLGVSPSAYRKMR